VTTSCHHDQDIVITRRYTLSGKPSDRKPENKRESWVVSREIRCGSCGVLNRVVRYSIARLPKCGNCGTTLPEPRATKFFRFFYRNRSWGRYAPLLIVLAALGGYRLFVTYIKPSSSEVKPPSAVEKPAGIEFKLPEILAKPAAPKIQVCSRRPNNGQIIYSARRLRDFGHLLTIDNGSEGSAIVKVRDTASGRVVVSFFVDVNATASFAYLSDGNYRIQYVLGGDLAENCKAFIQPLAVEEFPGVESFLTTYTSTDTSTHVGTQSVTFTLYSVPSGTVRPRPIDLKEFDAE